VKKKKMKKMKKKKKKKKEDVAKCKLSDFGENIYIIILLQKQLKDK
jgi:hypothetical protein